EGVIAAAVGLALQGEAGVRRRDGHLSIRDNRAGIVGHGPRDRALIYLSGGRGRHEEKTGAHRPPHASLNISHYVTHLQAFHLSMICSKATFATPYFERSWRAGRLRIIQDRQVF